MSCEKTRELDLGEFLLEREEPQWQEFRNHYPGCADCSEEVARWGKLEQLLRTATAVEAHPSEEKLLALTTLSLVSAERVRVEEHVSGCAACRSEVAVLKSFDFSAVQPVQAPAASQPFLERAVTSLAEWRESLSASTLRPALMAAAVVLLAVPIGIRLWDGQQAPKGGASGGAEFVQAPAADLGAESPLAIDPAPAAGVGEDPQLLAEVEVPDAPVAIEVAAVPEPMAAPALRVAPGLPAAETIEIAGVESAEGGTPVADRAAPEIAEESELVLGEGETILIAALLPGDLPLYGLDPMMGMGGPSVRTGGFVRSLGPEAGALASIEVLSPDHVGWTSKAAPTLYWRLSAASDLPVEIVISDDESLEPLLETRLTGLQAAGIHALSLAEQGLELSPETTYRWSVSLVVDDEHRSKDRFASSALLYRPASGASAADLASAGPGEVAHRYAAQGYWYDAFDQLTLWLEAEPRSARILEHRSALLEQVGLGSEPTSH
ncbi:MAG: DUF928 domain-containing protein [Myxococcota bacterium]|nr:DUF928 domain-containing protein [Myxococcota bacterium]